VFLHTHVLYVYFVSPYFYHDAFMHHPMHLLDAPVPNVHVSGVHDQQLQRGALILKDETAKLQT